MKTHTSYLLYVLVLLWSFAGHTNHFEYPVSPELEHQYSLHGKNIDDPFTWLENTDSEQTLNWATEQDQFTLGLLDKAKLETTKQRILTYSEFLSYRQFNQFGDQQFYLKGWAGTTTAALYVESQKTGNLRQLAGPDLSRKIDDEQQTSLISRFWLNKDGKYVLAIENKMGERWAEILLIEVATGKVLQRINEGVYLGLSQVSWSQIDNQFLVSLYKRGEQGSPEKVWLQSYSVTDATGQTVYRPENTGEHWVLSPTMLRDAKKAIVHQRNGSETANSVLLLDLKKPNSKPQWLFENKKANRLLLGNHGDDLFFYSDEQAVNGKVIKLNLRQPLHAKTIIEQTANPISNNSSVGGNATGMFGETIALTYLDAGRYIVRGFNLAGKQRFQFKVPDSGSIWGGFNGNPLENQFYFGFLGIGEPSSIYRVNSEGKRSLVKAPELPFDLQITAKRVYVESEPGVRIPVLIAHRKGLDLSGTNPVIHYAYGGFGWVSFMWYQSYLMEWFERGGIYVISGVRGGGEYGSSWHQAGIKQLRQNAVNDYLATSKWLIASGLTESDKLIANGGSLSGALIGAAVLQQPQLFGAALIDFPVMDLLRYNQFGSAKYWHSEFGSPEIKEEFRALLNYSPYHGLNAAECLPPVLIRTGEFDQTTTPMHGYKFVARAQQKRHCKNPVLLDVMKGAGHNFGAAPEQISNSHAVALTFIRKYLLSNQLM